MEVRRRSRWRFAVGSHALQAATARAGIGPGAPHRDRSRLFNTPPKIDRSRSDSTFDP